jgi:MFS family permease
VYLVRTAAMNASYPIQRAILMDLVPKKQRGRWNSLENLTSFTWTGSAALGGVLVDRFGYRFTFLITAALYSAACFLLALLIPLTRGEVCDDENDEAGAGAAGAQEEVVAASTGG